MRLKVEMSVSEYEKFLERYFPGIYKFYEFMVKDVVENSFYEENDVKNLLLKEIIPLVNEKIEEICKKKGE